MKLQTHVVDLIKKDEAMQLEIAKDMGFKISTIKAWLRNADKQDFPTAFILIVMKHTGKSEQDVVVQEGSLAPP